jgi:hypothetical protein
MNHERVKTKGIWRDEGASAGFRGRVSQVRILPGPLLLALDQNLSIEFYPQRPRGPRWYCIETTEGKLVAPKDSCAPVLPARSYAVRLLVSTDILFDNE